MHSCCLSPCVHSVSNSDSPSCPESCGVKSTDRHKLEDSKGDSGSARALPVIHGTSWCFGDPFAPGIHYQRKVDTAGFSYLPAHTHNGFDNF